MDKISKILLGKSIIKSRDLTTDLKKFLTMTNNHHITLVSDINKLIIRLNDNNLYVDNSQVNSQDSQENKKDALSIVYIFMGNVPHYIRESYYQLRYWTDAPIYLITDDVKSINLLSDTTIKVVLYDTIKNPKCNKFYEFKNLFGVVNGLINRELLFFYSAARFIILEAFMEKYNIRNIFHLEVDNLVYFDPCKYVNILASKPIAFMTDYFKRGCAGLFFARSAQDLDNINNSLIDYVENKKGPLQEMIFLGEYLQVNRKNILVLPCMFNNANELCTKYVLTDFYEHFELFGGDIIFDPASIGIVFTGEDPYHTKGILRKGFGHKNIDTVIDYSKCVIEWEYNNNLKYPLIRYNGRYAKIGNLHVHSKDLLCNMSGPLPYPKNRTFITGNNIQQIAKLCVGVKTDFNNIGNWLDINEINNSFDNPNIIYMHGHSLKLLTHKLQMFNNKFILISHNSDELIDDKYKHIFDHDKIIAVYAQNNIVEHEKSYILPIGIANPKWKHGDIDTLKKTINQNIHFTTNKIYFYFNNTSKERIECYNILSKKGLKWNKEVDYEKYLMKLKKCEYVICPEGNGIDTHRFFETIYLGRIPIVKNNPLIQKYLPYYKMVILEKWEDFNIDNIKIYSPNKTPKLWIEDYINELHQKIG